MKKRFGNSANKLQLKKMETISVFKAWAVIIIIISIFIVLVWIFSIYVTVLCYFDNLTQRNWWLSICAYIYVQVHILSWKDEGIDINVYVSDILTCNRKSFNSRVNSTHFAWPRPYKIQPLNCRELPVSSLRKWPEDWHFATFGDYRHKKNSIAGPFGKYF